MEQNQAQSLSPSTAETQKTEKKKASDEIAECLKKSQGLVDALGAAIDGQKAAPITIAFALVYLNQILNAQIKGWAGMKVFAAQTLMNGQREGQAPVPKIEPDGSVSMTLMAPKGRIIT